MNISVVIPNYNGRDLLEKHMPSVVSALEKDDEILVVDDASTDDSIIYLNKNFPRVNIVKNVENKRYADTCNNGIEQAKNEFVLLLNNDVSPNTEVKKNLLPHFNKADVFAVGCLECSPSGQKSGKSIGNFSRGIFAHSRASNLQFGTTMWATGGSMMVRKSYWQAIGGMDNLYRPAYYEDIDLSYRAWKHGWLVLFEPKAFVKHEHESTNASVFGIEGVDVMSYKNLFLFLWKNITDSHIFFSHVLWLPYHLIVGGWRSQGRLIAGFIQALLQMSEVVEKRRKVSRLWTLTDDAVMKKVHT